MDGLNQTPTPPPLAEPVQGLAPFIGGLVQVLTPKQVLDNERAAAEKDNSQPVVLGIAGYVKNCWNAAFMSKRQTIEQRLLQSLRQRNGEYDPDLLNDIRQGGGSEIYMMLTSNKCRAASSWLRDVMMANGSDKSWGLEPTRIPEISPDEMQEVVLEATQEAMEVESMMGSVQMSPDKLKEVAERIYDRTIANLRKEAREDTERMEDKMEDQLQEGGFFNALSEFLSDIVTFPAAFMKGPVVRNRKQLTWIAGQNGKQALEVQTRLVPEWERVDPFMIYPAPHSSDINDGYLIERHHLTRSSLSALIGVEGYSDAAIRSVLNDYGKGGLREWLYSDAAKAIVEGKSLASMYMDPEQPIDALQFWGSVQGKMLIEWGMTEEEIPDPTQEYDCEVWLIGNWVIKATLNYDPLGRKPYYKASYEEVPGGFYGNSVADLVRDCAGVCNAAARSLVNNMGIASGPQTWVAVDRLPEGENISQLYPWKIHQVKSDTMGGTAPPIGFFQPSSNASELMGIYEKFSVLADEYSGVPRYMTGDAPAGGAGRTASGMSMLMGNAGKAMKQVVSNIDVNIMSPMIERLYFYNMKYSDDPMLKGDVKVIARGASLLIQKEQAQVRKNEFLSIIASNPMFIDIVGEEAIAALLREAAKGLDMDTDEVVPPPEVIRARIAAKQKAIMQQSMMQQQLAGQPTESISFQRDGNGTVQGAQIMPGNRQKLMNGASVTDNFSPARKA